jgi:hypothetical protein
MASCAPATEPAVSIPFKCTLALDTDGSCTQKLAKRDTCVFVGQHVVDAVVGGGGPGQGPVSFTYDGLSVTYAGGVAISPALGGKYPDAITEKVQTFTPAQTRMPKDITWSADFNLGYSSCTVTYEGVSYTGGPTNPGTFSAGTSAWQCNVSFPCEGGITPLASK